MYKYVISNDQIIINDRESAKEPIILKLADDKDNFLLLREHILQDIFLKGENSSKNVDSVILSVQKRREEKEKETQETQWKTTSL